MRGSTGLLVGLVVFALGFAGLGLATDQLMSHADPNASIKAVAGIGTFVVMCLITLAMVR